MSKFTALPRVCLRSAQTRLPSPSTRHIRRYASSVAEDAWRSRRRLAIQVGGALTLSTILIWTLPRVRNDELVDDPSPPSLQASAEGLIPFGEVQKHNTADDCWVVIEGRVYDLTEFAQSGHPGGSAPIHRVAGRDATSIFKPLHPPGTIENGLDESAYLGNVDPQTLPSTLSYSSGSKTLGEEGKEREVDLAEIVGLPDFDAAAKAKLTGKAWAYMSSGATDQYTLDLNRKAFNHILFRPRILVNVEECDTRTKMMGQEADLPFFICPTGMAGLAHPLGERAVARAAGDANVIYMVSTNASTPLTEIVENKTRPDQKFFMQLYVDRNRPKTEKLLEQINGLGMKALFVTVDAAAPGKREADERSRAEIEVASGISGGKIAQDSKGGGIGRSVGGFIDPKLNWDDLKWLRKHTDLPIGLKGVQSVEDCIKAAELGVNAIYLSNHGALDTAPPSLYTLLELRKLAPQVFDKCEIYLDGGVRRGTDVIKALCLGAKGVGMGRPFLYGLTYGQEGVTHAIEIMRDEIQTTMRLLGVTRLNQLGPHLLNTKALDTQIMDHIPKQP